MIVISKIIEIIKVGAFLYKYKDDPRLKEVIKTLEEVYKEIKKEVKGK